MASGIGGASCCFPKEDNVAGEGTGLAEASKDWGRERNGFENDFANAAKDGKEGDIIALAVATSGLEGPGVAGDVTSFIGGEGVRGGGGGGGGCPSRVAQASCASFSSRLARGSNSFSTAFDTASPLGSGVGMPLLKPANSG